MGGAPLQPGAHCFAPFCRRAASTGWRSWVAEVAPEPRRVVAEPSALLLSQTRDGEGGERATRD